MLRGIPPDDAELLEVLAPATCIFAEAPFYVALVVDACVEIKFRAPRLDGVRFVCAAAHVFAYKPRASSLYLRGRASRVILGGRPAAAASAFFLFFLLCEADAAASHRTMTVSRPGAILFGPYPDGLFLTVNCPRARRVKPPQMTPS